MLEIPSQRNVKELILPVALLLQVIVAFYWSLWPAMRRRRTLMVFYHFVAILIDLAFWAKFRVMPLLWSSWALNIPSDKTRGMHAWDYSEGDVYDRVLPASRLTISNLTDAGRAFKEKFMNKIGHSNIKGPASWGNSPMWNFWKFFKVTEEQNPIWASRGYGKLKDILAMMAASGPEPSGKVVDLCAGRGGWSQCMAEYDSVKEIQSYTLKSDATKTHQYFIPESAYGKDKIKWHYEDITNVQVYASDWVLFDGGESYPRYDQEEEEFYNLLTKAVPWIHHSTHFVFKILVPYSTRVIALLEGIQRKTGRGVLRRLKRSRNSNMEMYFMSLPADPHPRNLEIRVKSEMRCLQDRHNEARRIFQGLHAEEKEKWEKAETAAACVELGNFPKTVQTEYEKLPPGLLQPLDMEATIEEAKTTFGTSFSPPLGGRTTYAKEIGYFDLGKNATTGNCSTRYNEKILAIIKPLIKLLPDFKLWRTTDSTPRGVHEILRRKIDTAPKENHEHYGNLRSVFSAFSQFLKEQGKVIRYQSESQVQETMTRSSSMGEPNPRGYTSIGDYFDSGTWREDLQELKTSLMNLKPIGALFNIIGKSEVKYTVTQRPKGSRFVWFYPAKMRLLEMFVLGSFNEMVKAFPFSVSGLPGYDYGDFLRSNWKEGWAAACEDVAGWDTRMGVGFFSLENEFLQSLADESSTKKWIELLYRLWAYPLYAVRLFYKKTVHLVLFRAQGGKASGIQMTYGMNTVTNGVVLIYRCLKTMKVPDSKLNEMTLAYLKRPEDFPFRLVVSGDDSVVMGTPEFMRNYQVSYEIHNELGLLRKDMSMDAPTQLVWSFEQIDFCSHSYVLVEYKSSYGTVSKYMQARNEDQILAKGCIMKAMPASEPAKEGWARVQGLNMLLNYHHLGNIRLVALAVLDATSPDVQFDGLTKMGSWKMFGESPEWIKQETVLDILNKCLFGSKTRYPKNFKLDSLKNLGYASRPMRERFARHTILLEERRAWRDEHLVPTVKAYGNMRVASGHQLGGWLMVVTSLSKRWGGAENPQEKIGFLHKSV